jgi:hypothetical protein
VSIASALGEPPAFGVRKLAKALGARTSDALNVRAMLVRASKRSLR